MTTILTISALTNVLLAIWLLRTISRIARLEQDAADNRIELRLAKNVRSSYARKLLGMRESGL